MSRKSLGITDEQILARHLYGESLREIAKDVGVYHTTITDRINHVRSDLSKQEIEAIRAVTVPLRRANIPVESLIDGARISSKLKKKNINAEKFDEFLHTVYEGCETYGIEALPLIECANELFTLQKGLDVPIREVPTKVTELVSKHNEITQSIEELETKKRAEQRNVNQILANAKLTEQMVKQYKQSEQILNKYGIRISEVNKFANVLANAKSANNDLSLMIEMSKETGNFKENLHSLAEQERKLQEKRKELSDLNTQVQGLEKECMEKKGSVKALGKIETELSAQVAVLDKHLISSLESLKNNVEKSTNSVLTKIEEANTKSKKVVETANEELVQMSQKTVKQVKESCDTIVQTAQRTIRDTLQEEVKRSIDSLEGVAIDAVKAVGRIKFLQPLAEIMQTGDGRPEMVFPAIYHVLISFEKWVYPYCPTASIVAGHLKKHVDEYMNTWTRP